MKIKHQNHIYNVDFFFGKTGEPKQNMDETTPCLMTTCAKYLLCAEVEFLDDVEPIEPKGKIGFTDEDFNFDH